MSGLGMNSSSNSCCCTSQKPQSYVAWMQFSCWYYLGLSIQRYLYFLTLSLRGSISCMKPSCHINHGAFCNYSNWVLGLAPLSWKCCLFSPFPPFSHFTISAMLESIISLVTLSCSVTLLRVGSLLMFNCLCASNFWGLFHAGASQEFDNKHCEASKDICPWSAQHPIFTKTFRLGIAKWFCAPGKFLPDFHSPPRVAIRGSSSRLPFLPFSIQHRFTCNLAYMAN